MAGATPALWALGPSQDQTATLNIRVHADIDHNRFTIAVWNESQGRRTFRTRHVEVPEGGDLGDLGRVCKDLVECWLWDPHFVPSISLLLAISRYYSDDQ